MFQIQYLTQIVAALPVPSLVLNIDAPYFSIVEANSSFSNTTNINTGSIISKPVQEVLKQFTNTSSDNLEHLSKSLSTVVATKKIDTIVIQPSNLLNDTKNRAITYWQIDNTPILDDAGNVMHILQTITDITEKTVLQQAQIRTKNLKDDFTKFINASLDLIFVIDAKGTFLKVNNVVETVLGYKPEELIGTPFIRLVHPADVIKTEQTAANLMNKVDIRQFKNRYIHKNGSIVHLEWTASWNSENEVRYGIARDITDKINNELALLESEKKYKNIFENNPMPMAIWDIDTLKIVDCNNEILLKYGYTKAEILNITIKDLQAADEVTIDEQITKPKSSDDLLNKQTWQHKKKNGELIFVDVITHPIEYNNKKASLILINDITEKLTAELQLKQSNERFEFVTKATSDAIWDWDLITGKVVWGEGFETIFGYKKADITDTIDFRLNNIHPEDKDRVLQALDDLMNGTESNWEDQYRFLKADKTYAYIVNRGFVIRNTQGKVIRMVGAKRDITKRKKEILRLQLLETVITNTTDTVLISEAEPIEGTGPKIIYINEAFTRMTGYTLDEVIGKNPRLLQGPKSDRKELDRLKEALRNWEPCNITVINYKKNGEEFWVNISISPVADENGWFTHWIAIQRDITDKKLEEQKITKAIIKAQEDERYEIGTELHDNVCQILTTSQLSIKMLQRSISPAEMEWYNQGINYIKLAFTEIRNLSHRLAPTFFDDTTLEEAICDLVKSVNIEKKYTTKTYFNEAFKQFQPNKEFQLNLYRILQEQLRNILTHAQASTIEVNCLVEANKLKMYVVDDGIGLNITTVKSGIGFANMRRRAELFAGKFEIESLIGNGCKISLEIPLP